MYCIRVRIVFVYTLPSEPSEQEREEKKWEKKSSTALKMSDKTIETDVDVSLWQLLIIDINTQRIIVHIWANIFAKTHLTITLHALWLKNHICICRSHVLTFDRHLAHNKYTSTRNFYLFIFFFPNYFRLLYFHIYTCIIV